MSEFLGSRPETGQGLTRRDLLLGALGLGAGLVLGGCDRGEVPMSTQPEASASPEATLSPEQKAKMEFLTSAAESLLARREEFGDGWRFESQIQFPHYQTDRDVGAAGVGMGFLAMANLQPNDSRWLAAAKKTAAWLEGVSRKQRDGRFWPDYADDGDISPDVYTSFDDGTLGVGDFFWRLYEATGNEKYKKIALESVEWTFEQAEKHNGGYRWRWNMNPGEDPVYNMGMGMGAVGLVHTFATYYERTKTSNPQFAAKCKEYIDGAVKYIDGTRRALGGNDGDARALPETGVIGNDGDTAMNSGYLSGAAGAAFMYMKLYQVFRDSGYKKRADEVFSWLNDTSESGPKVDFGNKTAAWKLMLDPQGGDDPKLATGMEEGAAGIGWSFLQAYVLTGERKYLSSAIEAGNWLVEVAIKDNEKVLYSWHEDEHPKSSIAHPNLNNGAAGIGMFLYDLYLATKEEKYYTAAKAARDWLVATAVHDSDGYHWRDEDSDAGQFENDPSWHWGSAGIIAFLARMNGGTMDIPGEQSGFAVRAKA